MRKRVSAARGVSSRRASEAGCTDGGGGVSETVMGAAIQLGMEKGTWERDDLVISTKIFFGGRGRRDTM